MPRIGIVACAFVIGIYCSLASAGGDPAYGRSPDGTSSYRTAQNVDPGWRNGAAGWGYREESTPPLSGVCKSCLPSLSGSPAGGPLRLPVSAWAILAAMFILAGVKFPMHAVTLWFFGLAGFVVGGTSQFIDLTWQLQLVVFGLSGIGLVLTWSRLDQEHVRKSGDVVNSRHPASMHGRVFRLQKPIVNGTGMLTVGETTWRIAGQDCAAGEQVQVVHVEGTLLVVNAVAR